VIVNIRTYTVLMDISSQVAFYFSVTIAHSYRNKTDTRNTLCPPQQWEQTVRTWRQMAHKVVYIKSKHNKLRKNQNNKHNTHKSHNIVWCIGVIKTSSSVIFELRNLWLTSWPPVFLLHLFPTSASLAQAETYLILLDSIPHSPPWMAHLCSSVSLHPIGIVFCNSKW